MDGSEILRFMKNHEDLLDNFAGSTPEKIKSLKVFFFLLPKEE